MKASLIKDYLGSIESAAAFADKSKTLKAITAARVKLHKSIEPKAILTGKAKQGNTRFEELTGLGFYPQERRLEATLKIKQPFGYGGGGVPLPGTYEYVAFYVNWNGDSDFSDTGEDVCASYVHMYDPGPAIKKIGSLCYAVYRDIIPLPPVKPGAMIRVRAILSWNQKPTGPNFVPIWGNVLDCAMKLDPIY